MLPTKGFFKNIDCPYHERKCGRPYCHFRHRKKTQDAEDAASTSASAGVPTYKPTPKSELAGQACNRSHIPISYVPDVVRSTTRQSYNIKDRPTYKPTPKSVLSGVKKQPEETNETSVSVSTYTPTPINQLKDVQSNNLNIEEEIQLIDEILTETVVTVKDSQLNIIKELSNKEVKQTCDIIKTTQEKANEIIAALNATSAPSDNKKKSSYDKDKEKSHSKDKSRDDKSKDRHKDKHKSSSRDKDKDKDKKSSNSKSSSKDNKKSTSHSSSSSRNKSSSKSTHSSSSKSRTRDKHKSSSSTKHKTEKSKTQEIIEEPSPEDLDDTFDLGDLADEIDTDSVMIADECLRIFNEYKAPVPVQVKPPEPLKLTVPDAEPQNEQYTGSKKRIAYNNAVKDEIKERPAFKPLLSAGMTLHNRMKMARQAQAANEAQSIMAEVKNMKRVAHVQSTIDLKRLKPNGLSRPEKSKPQQVKPQISTNLIDDILNAKSTTTAGVTMPPVPASLSIKAPIRRFAPASNIMSIQMAKARIDEIKNRTVGSTSSKTVATTVSKGIKRAAHVPDMSLSNIPDVLQAERSKLPVNVRTRYLGLLADECVKLYVATEEAYNRALNEEFKCYERCKALPTYRNSAMLAINRLRKEVQEREASGLGPLQIGETHGKSSDSYLEGKKFYELVEGFMLSDEELVQHGFPREGPTPGKAVINSEYKQQTTSEHLEPNHRLCCRCHKIYIINREGFPLFEEECCYHPLRKRTIRGERTYLCCKSTEDTGCAVSSTHVSEVSADRELEGFQSTFESDLENDPRNFAVYALDCEMCYTTKGLELTRVTVVNSKLKTIYESLVKPFNPIIDYNTRFSGITAEHMENTTTNILQIQATILHLCSSKTILIGHSLESDMKALKIIHNSVVDTSVMFPHKFGLPHKRALRVLASEYLKKIIQNDVGGHDSAEDALAAMELVLWKVKEDLKVKGIKC